MVTPQTEYGRIDSMDGTRISFGKERYYFDAAGQILPGIHDDRFTPNPEHVQDENSLKYTENELAAVENRLDGAMKENKGRKEYIDIQNKAFNKLQMDWVKAKEEVNDLKVRMCDILMTQLEL